MPSLAGAKPESAFYCSIQSGVGLFAFFRELSR